ncbi:ABC transporter ATP-binding protein [Nocardia cyriacigeorgica]|uniref:ABC transporter ATP-binding protein n=1 Tax=Nocardia cyriacigeorgica TaxID=135487 RepID=A0A6P1D1L2_9NOCA|nr:ABC transporter ATP-binding protein [Nocardia cyriacigeorgica]NEW41021.1 ABC transporter ATP-binding protein [Nocardia cyriacigeorgica]NEW44287.1 ABC transporter ATP-binding protein [Nocardia cyriacigeorgica]NEW51174.1 ABC transporter ATP-binding protein [Nocardia cyriacigeorgica]NEW55245.1 ABC transporter ATP-binding protein [Nocardia cyriacigeorgica]
MITMIRYLMELLDDGGRRRLRTMLWLQGAQGVLQGIGFLFVAPLIGALAADPVDGTAVGAWIAAIAVVVGVHHALFSWSTSMGYLVGTDVLTSFHTRIGNHLARLPIGWFGPDRTGPVGRLLGKATMDVANVPAHLLRHVVVGVTAPITMIIGSYVLDWRIGAAFTAGAVLCVLALWLLMEIIRRNDDQYEDDIGATASRIVEFARQQPTLRAYGVLERPELGTLEESLERQQLSQSRLTIRGAWGLIAFYGTVQLVVTAVIALAVGLAVDGTLAVPTMIGLLIITLRMLDPLAQLGDLAGHVQVNADAIRRVRALLAVAPLPEPARSAEPAGADVELRGVTFGYARAGAVLTGIDATLPQGSLTAVVGPSGAGKSTLLKLIARFFDVDDGEVLIGGRDVRELGSAGVSEMTAQVFQDVYLFEGTIAENLRMADPGASDGDLARVARIARLDEVIERLPDGWQTRVGEAGSTLSGGEKQRVSIARALLKDAPIVLLDEATAALDAVNEAAVADAIHELATDRTVVVVAHRLSTVLAADQILVLDQGRIVERGTHAGLVSAAGVYARFWNERLRAKGWQLGAANGSRVQAGQS